MIGVKRIDFRLKDSRLPKDEDLFLTERVWKKYRCYLQKGVLAKWIEDKIFLYWAKVFSADMVQRNTLISHQPLQGFFSGVL